LDKMDVTLEHLAEPCSDEEGYPGCWDIMVPGKIQAEDYNGQNGLQVLECYDEGGGEMLGDAHPGDWVSYDVSVATGGYYHADFRVAAPYEDGISRAGLNITVDGYSGDPDYTGTIPAVYIPSTGGYDDFATIRSADFYLPPGWHSIKFEILGYDWETGIPCSGGETCGWGHFNLNWFKLSRILPRMEITKWSLRAAAFDSYHYGMYQVGIPGTYNRFIGGLDDGEWVEYKVDMAYPGTYRVRLLLSQIYDVAETDKLNILVNGQHKGSVQIPDTEAWDEFQWVEDTIEIDYDDNQIIRIVGDCGPSPSVCIDKIDIIRTGPLSSQ